MEPHRFLDITTIPLVLPTRYPLLNGLSPVKDTFQRHTWSPIAHVRCVKILIFLYLLWFSLFQVSNENCETMESWKVAILTIQPQSHVRILIYRTWAICNFWNEKGTENEVRLAVVSGIVTGDVPVSYWPQWSSQKSLRKATGPSLLLVNHWNQRITTIVMEHRHSLATMSCKSMSNFSVLFMFLF